MVGAETDEVLIRRVVLLQIGKECAESPVEITDALDACRSTERRRTQIGAGGAALCARETFCEGKSCLHTRGDLEERVWPWVEIGRMQKDELVAVAQSLQMADGSLDAFVGEQTIPRRQQAIVTACCPVVDTDTVAHEI